MVRTLTCFLLALTVLIVALAVPKPSGPLRVDVPLDLAGITEVEVRAEGMAQVALGSQDAPHVTLGPDARDALKIARDGERLVIELPGPCCETLSLELPPGIRRLDVNGADISVADGVTVPVLAVHAQEAVYWKGDAGHLQLIDARQPATGGTDHPAVAVDAAADGPSRLPEPSRLPVPADNYCAGDCGTRFHINLGRIERLDVVLAREGLEINRTDTIGEATLRLGDRAWLGLGHARRVDNLRILALDAPTVIDTPADEHSLTQDAR